MPDPGNTSRKDNNRLEVGLSTTHLSLVTSNDSSAYFAETDSITVALAPTRDGECIAVFEPFAGFAVSQLERIRTAPGQFQHAAAGFFRRTADRSARKQITGFEIATVHGVMRKLLRDAPVKILKICARNNVRRVHRRSLQAGLKMNIEREIIFAAQVRQWFRILRRQRLPEWFECLERDNPGRNAGAKVLRQKRAERLIFPCLNVARAPVIHQHKAEDVIDSAIDRHRFA